MSEEMGGLPLFATRPGRCATSEARRFYVTACHMPLAAAEVLGKAHVLPHRGKPRLAIRIKRCQAIDRGARVIRGTGRIVLRLGVRHQPMRAAKWWQGVVHTSNRSEVSQTEV